MTIRVRAAIATLLATTLFALTALLVQWLLPVLSNSPIDWAAVAFVAYLGVYFKCAYGLWEKPAKNETLKSFPREFLREPIGMFVFAILQPALEALLLIAKTPHRIVKPFAFKIIDESWHSVYDRCIGALALIWASIFSILLFANLWQPPARGCPWVFPKILTCVLTQYEGLAGGVVGAGGAIFAAWIAWMAVQAQIRRDEK
jgi:hypothetical protein